MLRLSSVVVASARQCAAIGRRIKQPCPAPGRWIASSQPAVVGMSMQVTANRIPLWDGQPPFRIPTLLSNIQWIHPRRSLAGVGMGVGSRPSSDERAGGASDDGGRHDHQSPKRPRTLFGWVWLVVKIVLLTSGSLLWLEFAAEWFWLTTHPEVMEIQEDMMEHDERQSLKFYDVARLDDEEVGHKQTSLSMFAATLLRDQRLVRYVGEGADVINDPHGVFVHGPNAMDALKDVATIPDDCHPRDHWVAPFFLAGPAGTVAVVTAFRRSSDPEKAEWVPYHCAGVELLPKDGEPLFAQASLSRHGLKYTTRFA